MFPTSFTTINSFDFKISPANLLGDEWHIFKNGQNIGRLAFSSYRYSLITLNRFDGNVDNFRLDEEGYARVYRLTGHSGTLMRFIASLNPLRVDDKYDVELHSNIYSDEILHELIFYAGEILYRLTKPQDSAF